MIDHRVVELFGIPTIASEIDWDNAVKKQYCPFLNRTCLKVRKSRPEIAIGTCSVHFGVRNPKDILICPHRLLNGGRIFLDCLHLLRLHEPGNELHRVAEVDIPGGNVDYFLVSTQNEKVVDFVGIEIQTLDTTGTVWPQRQRFLKSVGVLDVDEDIARKPFGMNWKMTAKTILVQLNHKIETFEGLGKHLVLVMQDVLLEYMMNQFNFGHIGMAKLGHAMHFHTYSFSKDRDYKHKLHFSSRYSTDSKGMSLALGLQAPANIELDALLDKLKNKISSKTLLQL